MALVDPYDLSDPYDYPAAMKRDADRIKRILDRLRFCEDCLRAGVPDEYFGWADDQPSLGELARSDMQSWSSRISFSELKGWHWIDEPGKPVEWQIVPREPTKEMISAGGQAYLTGDFSQPVENQFDQDKQRSLPVWTAMLAAAPSPQPHRRNPTRR